MGGVSVIEGFPVDVLRVGRKMVPHGGEGVLHWRYTASSCAPRLHYHALPLIDCSTNDALASLISVIGEPVLVAVRRNLAR
jgi:hypothetical protein